MKQPHEMTEQQLDAAVLKEVMRDPIDRHTHYSTDHNAMAEVLAKIVEKFPGVQITRVTDLDRRNPEWAVNFNNPNTTGAGSYHKLLPRAVAEAALLAVRASANPTAAAMISGKAKGADHAD